MVIAAKSTAPLELRWSVQKQPMVLRCLASEGYKRKHSFQSIDFEAPDFDKDAAIDECTGFLMGLGQRGKCYDRHKCRDKSCNCLGVLGDREEAMKVALYMTSFVLVV